MITKKVLAGLGALALIAAMATTPAYAVRGCKAGANLTKGCKNEIKACVTSTCAGLTKKALRTCKATCKKTTVDQCKLSTAVCTGSPASAFLD